ncbi:MAG: hypothetical protein ACTHZX_05650 [Microbacterium sp.]
MALVQQNNRHFLTNLGSVFIVLAVVLIIRNVISVFNTPGWQEAFFFLLLSPNFVGMPVWVGVLLIYGPIPLIALGIVFVVIGRNKDKEKAAQLAAQAQQQYGGWPQGQPAPQGQPVPQAPQGQPAPQGQGDPYATPQPGQQPGQPPHGQVPPLS